MIDTRTFRFQGRRALSNMDRLPFNFTIDIPEVAVARLPTVEHAYQLRKFLDPTSNAALDPDTVLAILSAPDPFVVKRLSRRGQLGPHWSPEYRLSLMKRLLEGKFTKSPFHKEALLSTAAEPIAEIDPRGYDQFWGQSPRGIGQNNLGKLLEEIRTTLTK